MARFLFFLLWLLVVLIAVNGQRRKAGDAEILAAYSAAMQAYEKAMKASSAGVDEKLELDLNRRALEQFNQLAALLEKGSQLHDSLGFHTSFFMGELFHFFGDTDKALEQYGNAIRSKPVTVPDSLLFRPYIYSGIILYHQNRINEAFLRFMKADSIRGSAGVALREEERLYNTLGVIYYETGNYRLAGQFFKKALSSLEQENPFYLDLQANYLINLAQIHLKLEDFDEARKLYGQLASTGRHHEEVNLNLGLIDLNLGAPATALKYFRKVPLHHAKALRLVNNFSRAFLDLKQFDSLQHYLQLADSFYARGLRDEAGYGMVLKTKGDFEMARQDFSKALQYYHLAQEKIIPGRGDVLPEKFSGVFSYINLFDLLTAKAVAWHQLFLGTNRQEYAVNELQTYKAAFRLMDHVKFSYNSDEARLFINRKSYEIHDQPINTAYQLFSSTGDEQYLEDLYVFDQKNKASVLVVNQQMEQQLVKTGDAAGEKAAYLKTQLTRLSVRAMKTDKEEEKKKLARQMEETEIELARLQDLLVRENKELAIPSIAALQKEIPDRKTVIVSYHLDPEKLTTVLISKSKAACYQDPLPPVFFDAVSGFVKELRDPALVPDEKNRKLLSQLLLKHLPQEDFPERIIIIPDDELNLLPFEVLGDGKNNYLVERAAIQYQYSTALLKQEKLEIRRAPALAMAPFTSPAPGLQFAALPHSATEIEFLEGRHIRGKEATKTAFLQYYQQYRIIHLATHAVSAAGAENSYIVFAGEKDEQETEIYAAEIAGLDMTNTSLVLLSACETGGGDLIKGEGVMSLSRAFSYAGCPNIITSLWKANDFSTSWITGRVHHYIEKGQRLDRAVQLARTDYLKDAAIHPRMKHPYYWAHLVFIGNMMEDRPGFSWIYVIIPFAVILLWFGIRRFRISRKAS